MASLPPDPHTSAADPASHNAPTGAAWGFAGWPDGAGPPCRATLPDGTDVPSIAILVRVEEGSLGSRPARRQATLQSIAGQGYPRLETLWVADDQLGRPDGLRVAIRATAAEFVLVLRSGDMLAPGALAALALAAWQEEADAVVGLRVLYGEAVGCLDMLSPRIAVAWGADPGTAPTASRFWAFGGDVLISTRALAHADAVTPAAGSNPEISSRLEPSRLRLARIGRPVLLRNEAARVTPNAKQLRVAAVNDSGPAGGGAGIAHRRLIEALRCGGHDVTIHALNREAPPAAAEWTDLFPDTEAAIREAAPDLVLVGNIHGATRTSTILGRLGAVAPVAAVLHDLFLLTGRCAHPGGASRIDTGCDALCPRPDFYPQLAPGRIAGIFAQKRAVLSGPNAPVLVAASDWVAARARDLGPPGMKVARVDLAFPTQVFRPGDKRALRRRLGLPEGDFLILFAAIIADQPDKGSADLLSALARVAGPGIGFVALGRIDDPGSFRLPNLVAPGLITDEEDLACWYGACDLHVTASRLETLGQTPIEAGLCGVPTVAYRATGLTTAVIDGVSGLLVDSGPTALAEAIAALMADPDRLRALSIWGRIALESRNSHAAAYLGLHDMLVDLALASPQAERIVFMAETLGTFADAAAPWPGARGNVKHKPHPVVRLARRAKQRLWGRAQPLWMRRGVYLAARMRRAARTFSARGVSGTWRSRQGAFSARGDVTDMPPSSPRRIIVDQTHLRGHVTGIERVALDLFSPAALAPHPTEQIRSRGLLHMLLEQQFGLSARGLADSRAIVIFPGFPPGPLAMALGRRCVIYVHDTFLVTRPQDLNWRARLYMAPSFAFALRHGRRFLVNSETTAQSLRGLVRRDASIELLRPPARDVFGLAECPPPPRFAPGQTLRLLAIGTIEPRKNYRAAIEITAALNAAGVPAQLHIVGRIGWGQHPFLSNPPPFLRLHHGIEDAGMRDLVAQSHLLISTSEAEGLGLPLLEVQHGGLPVVATRCAVFEEVLGGSGLLIETHDAAGAAGALAAWALDPAGLNAAGAASRANAQRWAGLAAADAMRFRRSLGAGDS